ERGVPTGQHRRSTEQARSFARRVERLHYYLLLYEELIHQQTDAAVLSGEYHDVLMLRFLLRQPHHFPQANDRQHVFTNDDYLASAYRGAPRIRQVGCGAHVRGWQRI